MTRPDIPATFLEENTTMPGDPLSRLEATIAASARERDIHDRKSRDDQATRDRQRDDARSVWAKRMKELPGIVKSIDGMLKTHGYGGLTMGTFDLKHPDIDRAVIEFEHNARNHSKILLCVTGGGDFTCSIGAVAGDVGSTKLPIAELTEERLQEAIALAVTECLAGKRVPRPERNNHPSEVAR
jgi:hypothetical protein